MAGTTSGARGRRAPIVGINVTPMVDVVLVLLVIMMVSATYIVEQSMRVELPTASSSDGSAASMAAVTITAEGQVFFGDEAVTEPVLIERLRAAAREREATLIVTADAHAQHGVVVHVMDLARTEGIASFAINVEQAQ
jgi:biopolymer transport protein ExbD